MFKVFSEIPSFPLDVLNERSPRRVSLRETVTIALILCVIRLFAFARWQNSQLIDKCSWHKGCLLKS